MFVFRLTPIYRIDTQRDAYDKNNLDVELNYAYMLQLHPQDFCSEFSKCDGGEGGAKLFRVLIWGTSPMC
jgi:hypothetical protein